MKRNDGKSHFKISRREAIVLLGTGLLAGRISAQSVAPKRANPSICIITPEQTEGPYFVDEGLNRSDIRSDPSDGSIRRGTLLKLTLSVSSVNNAKCVPLAGAIVDIWHCDAAGIYSDAEDPGFSTAGRKFLRGYQTTDANGNVSFTTIYPGWYPGRTVHIHVKVRAKSASGKNHTLTSQLYFDDSITDRVHAQEPYANKGRRTRNLEDGIFRRGGQRLMLPLTKIGDAYAARFNIGISN